MPPSLPEPELISPPTLTTKTITLGAPLESAEVPPATTRTLGDVDPTTGGHIPHLYWKGGWDLHQLHLHWLKLSGSPPVFQMVV